MNKKRSLLHSPKLKLRKTEPTLPVTGVDCASIGGGKKIFGTNSQMYPNLESFSSSSRSDNGLDVDARFVLLRFEIDILRIYWNSGNTLTMRRS